MIKIEEVKMMEEKINEAIRILQQLDKENLKACQKHFVENTLINAEIMRIEKTIEKIEEFKKEDESVKGIKTDVDVSKRVVKILLGYEDGVPEEQSRKIAEKLRAYGFTCRETILLNIQRIGKCMRAIEVKCLD